MGDALEFDRICIPFREFDFTFARSSGPGGQNVNKVESKAVLHWDVAASPSLPQGIKDRFLDKFASRINADDQLVLHSDRFRDKTRNMADCINKLKEMLISVKSPPKKRKKTKPTRASKERRLDEKKQQSQKKGRRGKVDW
jgi:ribosome-associated protein